MTNYQCFASTGKGLEELLVNELQQLGIIDPIIVNAGVKFTATFLQVMRVNLNSRIASRVMIQLVNENYYNETDIYEIAKSINWDDWFSVNNTIKVDTNAINCPLKSLEFITLKVKDAICDSFVAKYNERPDVNKQNPDMRIYNFLTKDTLTIYLDTSGESLFKRGYRQNKLEAPLKENLAAGLIQLTGWSSNVPFYDPMCGSGTIIIEAIFNGLNIAPGLKRNFAFERFELFERREWQLIQAHAKDVIKNNENLSIHASDIDHRSIILARQNLEKFGLERYVSLKKIDFINAIPPSNNAGIILTNPPYGVRLNELNDLEVLYPKISSNLKKNFANWECFFFTSDLRLPKLFRLKPSRKYPIFNGALDCRLFQFKMVSGSNRE